MDERVLLGLGLGLLATGAAAGWAWRRDRRRRLLAARFPAEFEAILERNAPLWRALPDGLKPRARAVANVLLAEKAWEGCGGLPMTDEVRVTVAGQAALLLLNGEPSFYPRLHSIVVYPSTYHPYRAERVGGELVEDADVVRAGESWGLGTLVLAWDQVLHRTGRPGSNVVLHEFAHQLDLEEGRMDDGLPLLPDEAMYDRWAAVMAREYATLVAAVEGGQPHVLDAYGATAPVEFFAVATEAFFESGPLLRERNPDLHALLRDFYGMDPATWSLEPTPACSEP